MKRTFHNAKRKGSIATLTAAALASSILALGTLAAPAAQAGGTKADEVATQDQGPMDKFIAWAKDQADSLDKKLDKAAAEATAMGNSASEDVKAKWKEARAAIDQQRKEVAKQVDDLKGATKDHWQDAKKATQQALNDLGDKIDEFQRMVTEDGKSKGKAPSK